VPPILPYTQSINPHTTLAFNLAGKRYGLTATQNLPVGSLLLVVPPLVAAYGEGGAAPGNEELVSQLDGQQLLPWQMQWLRLLYRDPAQSVAAAAANVEKQAANGGSGSSADGQGHVDDTVQQQQQQRQQQHHSEQQQVTSTAELAMLQQLLLQGGAFAQQAPDGNSPAVAVNPAAAAAAAGGGDASIASITCPLSTEQLQQLISENAYSEPSEDSGASLLRELTPESVTGLWPEFALLNHSCAPNTVAVVVGQYLLLRATAPVLAGEELSCSYLGQRGLAPVALRRAFLQGVYGFHCQVSCTSMYVTYLHPCIG
jgi:SET and MYND domain-containing protein